MTDTETKILAEKLTAEFLRIAYQNGVLPIPVAAEAYVKHFKTFYPEFVKSLEAPPKL